MKISLTKALITFLLCIDSTFPETIQINRFIESGQWKNVVDSFDIPQSVCHDESRGYGDYCNTSCTIHQDVARSQGSYSCPCNDNSATITYLNKRWRCLENQEVRTQLGELFVLFVGTCTSSVMFLQLTLHHPSPHTRRTRA